MHGAKHARKALAKRLVPATANEEQLFLSARIKQANATRGRSARVCMHTPEVLAAALRRGSGRGMHGCHQTRQHALRCPAGPAPLRVNLANVCTPRRLTRHGKSAGHGGVAGAHVPSKHVQVLQPSCHTRHVAFSELAVHARTSVGDGASGAAKAVAARHATRKREASRWGAMMLGSLPVGSARARGVPPQQQRAQQPVARPVNPQTVLAAALHMH